MRNMADKKSSVLLEGDDRALKRTLMLPFQENSRMPDEFESLLPLFKGGKSQGEVKWKLVQPVQGKCIKTHSSEGAKIFINICHTPDIPSPHNLDEETLLKMYASLDEESPDTGIRIPLSIGECHEEQDKSGDPCKAFDVAVSSEFFERTEISRVHLRFLIQVAIEAVADKFKLEVDVDQYSVLKNRKAMGKLQQHRIEQRAPQGTLIQELDAPPPRSTVRPPERWRMTRRAAFDGSGRAWLVAELSLAEVVCAEEVRFLVNEDRLTVESARRGYGWNVFVPLPLDAEAARATFVRNCRVLNIKVPIVNV